MPISKSSQFAISSGNLFIGFFVAGLVCICSFGFSQNTEIFAQSPLILKVDSLFLFEDDYDGAELNYNEALRNAKLEFLEEHS